MNKNKRLARFIGGFCAMYGAFGLLPNQRFTATDCLVLVAGVCFCIYGFSKD